MVHRRADVVLGVLVVALGAYALLTALNLALFGKHHVPGPGLFPALVSSMMLALGLLLAVLSARDVIRLRGGRSKAPAQQPADHETHQPLDQAATRKSADAVTTAVPTGQPSGEFRRIARATKVLVCYAIAIPLMTIIGFVPASAALVFLVLFGVEGRRNWRALTAAILIPVAAFLVFVRLLTIQLPIGLLNLGPLGS
jgi:hypothetical protein